jgi:3-oxoacyl-[acyl-carrier protein] reductase
MGIDLNLKDRLAIVGGASKGLGYGCAEALVQQGANVLITGRNIKNLEAAAIRLRTYGTCVIVKAGDMADPNFNNSIISCADSLFGRIDILVNNSGGPTAGKFSQFSDKDWLNAFNSVLMYNIRMTSMALELMRRNSWGRIINITSLSVKEPVETLVLSNVYRAGVVAFAKTISKELIKSNITINNLCPGAFKTDRAVELLTQAAALRNISMSELEKENIKNLPLGRYQAPSELGGIVAFLCSEHARGLTGTTIQVDGGISNSLF